MRPKTREERSTTLLGPEQRQALGAARLQSERFFVRDDQARDRPDISAAIAASTGRTHFDWNDPRDVAGLAWKGVEGYGAASLLAAPAFAVRAGIGRFLPNVAKRLARDPTTTHYNKFLAGTKTADDRAWEEFFKRMGGGATGPQGVVRQEAFGAGLSLAEPMAVTGALTGALGLAGAGVGRVIEDPSVLLRLATSGAGGLADIARSAGPLASEANRRLGDPGSRAFLPAGAVEGETTFDEDPSTRAVDSTDAVPDRGIDALYGGDLPAAVVRAIPPTTAPDPGLRRAVTGRTTEAPERAAPARTRGRHVEPAEVFNANVAATQLGYRGRTGILDPSFPGGF